MLTKGKTKHEEKNNKVLLCSVDEAEYQVELDPDCIDYSRDDHDEHSAELFYEHHGNKEKHGRSQ
jgi:hypothetical protein